MKAFTTMRHKVQRASAWAVALLLASSLLLRAQSAATTSTARAGALRHAPSVDVGAVPTVGLTVSDMDQAIEFYSIVLTFRKESDVEVAGADFEHLTGVFGARARVVRMRLADEVIELTEYLAPRGRPIPVDSRSQDHWFQHVAIIVRDMDRAYARLRQYKVEHASTGPQRLPDWNPNAGGIKAFYFRDPDHHNLEILEFPAGKGLSKWHRLAGDTLFLGIDHTAIVAGETRSSVAFYRDLLGMSLAGESENYGVEQEHLNNVFGARLHITALRAAQGPGIELLEYLTPQDGRPYPTDARANDLLHWETTLSVPDIARAERALRGAGLPFLSPGVVTLNDHSLGFDRAIVVRDPTGHVIRLIERP
jgi:catechol 2,3-dioxygenase-like lactoylglutathione lyase family enzyme